MEMSNNNKDKVSRLKKIFEDDYRKLLEEQKKYESGSLDFAFVGGQMDRIEYIIMRLEDL